MPALLFDPASRPAPVGGRRRLTVATSITMHAAAVAAVILIPYFGAVSMPAAMRQVMFVAPAELPHPPVPQPPAPVPSAEPAASPDAAPVDVPPAIEPEVPSPPAANVPRALGGVPVGSGFGVPGAVAARGAATLSTPPPPLEPVRPGGDIKAPARVSYAPPVYPAIAQSARVEGTVILEAVIDEAGAVKNLKILKSVPLLDEAARQAVSKWRYSPTTLNGVPVPVVMTVTVTFTLK
jgi:protein TonB